MLPIQVRTTKKIVPMIYAYTTPEIARHNGWTKIGYTEQDVDKRLDQQTHTADVLYHEEWRGNAIYEDGSGELFTDKDFHVYLKKTGVERDKGTEWFHIDGPKSKNLFYTFRSDRGILKGLDPVIPYTLRDEQEAAVSMTMLYRNTHEKGEVLWNAKPRFGKTLAVYDFCKRSQAQNVLIVTNRPAIANSWYSDYVQFLGRESGYLFVSNTEALKDKPYVLSREQFIEKLTSVDQKCIEFVSLQDLKGSKYFGGEYTKLKEVQDLVWDVLVIDEAHEGVDTVKTDVAFDHITRKFTIHLSGTPFKALANDKFPENAIFNWTYADEQAAKANWKGADNDPNPYANLPRLNMYTYQMSEIIRDELEQGIEIQGETEEYAFDLNEFFETKGGKFVHESSVDKFLDALTTLTKFPFSTPDLRDELRHTFWLLDRVESAKALAVKLNNHPVFSEYEVILAAGDGKLDQDEETKKSFDKVKEAISKYEKTITLSVGQLTTGVTIPEWTAVLMLSNVHSPSLYMQAAFRAQNPCLFNRNGEFLRKKDAYVFDFDPARTLTIYEEFANDLNADTVNGKGDLETRKKHICDLLNFFPVIGEDEAGEMIELDAEKVLTIPRKIRSLEVVRRGFMSDYLFQNISHIFTAPKEVIDLISGFTPVPEPKTPLAIPENAQEDLSLDKNGEVALTDEYVIGMSSDIFGNKIYDTVPSQIEEVIQQTTEVMDQPEDRERKIVEAFKDKFRQGTVKKIVDTAKSQYGSDMKPADTKAIEHELTRKSDREIEKVYGGYNIQRQNIEEERHVALVDRINTHKSEQEINAEFDRRQKEAVEQLREDLTETVNAFVDEASKAVVKTVEKKIKEREKKTIEDSVRDHLRGFSRTIPSFLMAYGTTEVTLATFDQIIPEEVFKEVTSITLEQFRFLRDGGKYIDEETGEEKDYLGNLFNPVVFDDSVQEFLRLKERLSNYFDETSTEDIFDYIPPQKTNQIFTPKVTVKRMVDMLEQENPGCFDQPDKTFIDLYMKSGLYITEIVKKLYRSDAMKKYFPDSTERLNHIFEHQVYGLAPTEIIYKIALAFILGFDKDVQITKHNLKLYDALPDAKAGTLDTALEALFVD